MKKTFILSLTAVLLLTLFSCSSKETSKKESPVLKEASPESAGMSSERLNRIDRMIESVID
ncbi:MAG TPA: hypothetical protein PL040_10810, partial [Bacteroidales bacterium]|nr:hypothetical protein [Bacteroidales bacterium]